MLVLIVVVVVVVVVIVSIRIVMRSRFGEEGEKREGPLCRTLPKLDGPGYEACPGSLLLLLLLLPLLLLLRVMIIMIITIINKY